MMTPGDKTAHKLFLASGSIDPEILDKAFKGAESQGGSYWKSLTQLTGMSEIGLYEILSKQTGIPLVLIKKTEIDPKALQKVPVKIAWYYKIFPYKIEDGRVWAAVSQVPDISTMDEIRFGVGLELMVALAPEKDIEEMLNKHYGLGAEMVNRILNENPGTAARANSGASTHHVEDLEKMAETASIAQLVNQIILEAYRKRASDIHLEPMRGKIRLRYRIDGVLKEAPVPAEMKKFFDPIISRIKIMSNLNVVEKRLPQDGKMRVKTQEQTLDLRVSSIPTSHGESVVIRILPGRNVWSLDSLGFDAAHLAHVKNLLKRPNGILFVTGPTGSGKSTTLYAWLTSLNSGDRKIITIEDPVEYELEGVSQIQVASDIGLGFSQGLRSVLRHDPDILMVGEVRDLETADISIRAALTGHLILSTLHTNDAASGITRLMDIGVQKYLVASSVIAFIAQRLIRKICNSCREPVTDLDRSIEEKIKRSLGLRADQSVKVFRGRGCDHCNGTGYAGRLAIHEVLTIDEPIRKLIMNGAPAGTIKREAMRSGMVTLLQDGFKKVLEGVTTPEEILQAAPQDPEEAFQPATLPVAPVTAPVAPALVSADVKEVVPTAEEKKNEEVSTAVNFANKRRFKRVPIQFPITFNVLENPAETVPSKSIEEWSGETQNISAGGLLFSSENLKLDSKDPQEKKQLSIDRIIRSGSVLELEIRLPDGEQPLRCVGRVLRLTRTTENDPVDKRTIFYIAILFLVIDSHDRLRIEKFCESMGNES